MIQARVSALEKYVNYHDAAFPTAIIISIEERFVKFDKGFKNITISNVPNDGEIPEIPISNAARVLDGQHRIAGLRKFSGEEFDLPVTVFVGADIADQAQIFATVNLEQQKVHKSLVYDLYGLAKSRSPQKTCHNIAVILDQDPASPFFKRIKRLGVATYGRRFEPISQATFVESLIRYISQDPKTDRDDLLRKRSLRKAMHEDIWKYPFRNLFIDDNDVKIMESIFYYFSAIKTRWPVAWASNDRGNVLNRTNGFRAFMRAYAHLHKLHGTPTGVMSKEFVEQYFNEVNLKDHDFNTENFPPGTSGEAALFNVIRDSRPM